MPTRCIAIVAVLMAADLCWAEEERAPYPVSLAVKSQRPDAKGRVVIHAVVTIRKGYYLYANPVGIEEAKHAQAKLTVTGGKSLRTIEIVYPEGEVVECDIVGNYRVYRKQVQIKAVVRRAANDREPLTVHLWVRPMEALGCRTPARTLKATLPEK